MTREQVIKGMECCWQGNFGDCKECPYHEDYPNKCKAEREQDALELLKAQEPRVLTLEEAINGPQVGYLEFKYHPERGWVKYDFITHLTDKEVIFLFSADVTFYQQEESYGRLWRLWTSSPTDEQRKAVKWDD